MARRTITERARDRDIPERDIYNLLDATAQRMRDLQAQLDEVRDRYEALTEAARDMHVRWDGNRPVYAWDCYCAARGACTNHNADDVLA